MRDRYGRNLPDLRTMCRGQCEGTGWIPVHRRERKQPLRALWLAAERKKPTVDGYHFVRCPDCGGTGKRKGKR